MIIDKNYCLGKIEEICKEIQLSNPPGKRSLFLKDLKCSLSKSLKAPLLQIYRLIKSPLNKKENILITEDMKAWSIKFLLYLMESEVKLDTSIYPEEDEKNLIKFIDNILKTSIKSFSPIEELVEEYYLWEDRYDKYWKSISKADRKIVYQGKEYYYPREKIQTSLFYHKNGTEDIPKKTLESLNGKCFIDCGAYCGDSCIVLSQLKPSKILAFEPDKENSSILKRVVNLNKLPVEIVEKGVGETEKTVKFANGLGGASSIDPTGKEEINITKIDNLRQEKIGLIKMDIEGSELEAIRGAEKTIKRDKPVLLICVYHTGKDFFEIPPLIKKWVPEYKLKFLNLLRTHPTNERLLLAYI